MFAALLKAGVSFAEIDGKTTVALWQKYKALRLVALSCPTLCNPMDCSSPSSSVHGDSPGKNTGVPCPPPGDLPHPGIEPGCPALPSDSSLSETPGKLYKEYKWSINFKNYESLHQSSCCSAMSNSLQPHGLQNTRPPCPSPIPRAYSNSCPLSPWCHPAISSSAVPFSSRLQSFPASGSFLMSQFFTSGGQRIGISATA